MKIPPSELTHSIKEPAWYAVQVRSRKESYIASQLENRGIECFLPKFRSVRRWSDRIKELDQPLFPGYLFCSFHLDDRRPLLLTPGVMQIVGTARTPTAVAPSEILALQQAVAAGVPRQPWPFIEVGEQVRVVYGSLSGLEGILLNFKGSHRVVLSVTLLQRSVAFEVDLAWVRPISVTASTRHATKAGVSTAGLAPVVER